MLMALYSVTMKTHMILTREHNEKDCEVSKRNEINEKKKEMKEKRLALPTKELGYSFSFPPHRETNKVGRVIMQLFAFIASLQTFYLKTCITYFISEHLLIRYV